MIRYSPVWPALVEGKGARQVRLYRVKCSNLQCTALTGSYYGGEPWCQDHAREEAVRARHAKEANGENVDVPWLPPAPHREGVPDVQGEAADAGGGGGSLTASPVTADRS